MISKNSIKTFTISSMIAVELTTMNNETCNIKKFTVSDTEQFAGLSPQDIAYTMVKLSVVDEKAKPIFDTIDEVKDLPVAVITEMLDFVKSHNEAADMESQAKKS